MFLGVQAPQQGITEKEKGEKRKKKTAKKVKIGRRFTVPLPGNTQYHDRVIGSCTPQNGGPPREHLLISGFPRVPYWVISDFPDHATFSEKGVNTGVVGQILWFHLFGLM